MPHLHSIPVVALVVGLVTLQPSVGGAATPAEISYEQAVALYRAGRHAEAAQGFEETYLFDPQPVLLVNAARSWEKAGQPARAEQRLRAVLRGEGVPEEVRTAALAGIARLTAPPPLGPMAGAWEASAVDIGGLRTRITVIIMPREAGELTGAFHLTGAHCGGILRVNAGISGTLVATVESAAGHLICTRLRALTLKTRPRHVEATWVIDGGDVIAFQLSPAASPEPRAAQVASAPGPPRKRGSPGKPPAGPGSARPETPAPQAPQLTIAGDLDAAEFALDSLPSWVGERVHATFSDGTSATGSLVGVRGTILILRLDRGDSWTGDILSLNSLRQL